MLKVKTQGLKLGYLLHKVIWRTIYDALGAGLAAVTNIKVGGICLVQVPLSVRMGACESGPEFTKVIEERN